MPSKVKVSWAVDDEDFEHQTGTHIMLRRGLVETCLVIRCALVFDVNVYDVCRCQYTGVQVFLGFEI